MCWSAAFGAFGHGLGITRRPREAPDPPSSSPVRLRVGSSLRGEPLPEAKGEMRTMKLKKNYGYGTIEIDVPDPQAAVLQFAYREFGLDLSGVSPATTEYR